MPDPDLEALLSLSAHLLAAVGAITDEHLTLPTPCADWDLTALVDHVTGGNWFTCQVFHGHTARAAMTTTMEQFGGGSASSQEVASSVSEQLAAFQQPGVLDRTWHHVAGDLSGRQILRLRLHDLIVHSWDITQTIEPPASLPPDLVRWGLAELSTDASLAEAHFDLTAISAAGDATDEAAEYLSRFGRPDNCHYPK